MITFEEAYRRVIDSAVLLGAEDVPLNEAFNRILAKDVVSDSDIPPFDKSAMDGFACKREDINGVLKIVDVIHAGNRPTVVGISRGECAKIMTGAVVPRGADCVIMREYVCEEGEGFIRFTGAETASNICPAGEDIGKGEIVLKKGELIRAPHIATLATVGCDRPLVYRRPRVGVIATGSELIGSGENISGAKIRDSNSPQLMVQIISAGAIPKHYGIVEDDEKKINNIICEAMDENDLIVITGGVSVGDLDLVPGVLKKCGFIFLFEKVAMKPGRPTIFGRTESGKYCCGLPGNPVSTFVVFEIMLKPFILKLMGYEFNPITFKATLGVTLEEKNTHRREAIPVRFAEPGVIVPVDFHGSADISALCEADGLVFFAARSSEIRKGETVDVRSIWA